MKGIFLSIVIAVLFFLASLFVFSTLHSILISLIVLMVVLWTNEALPLGVVSILPIILFPIFGILDFSQATSNYSKPIIFLFIGGFLLSVAVEKSGLHKLISNKILAIFPATPIGIIYSFAVASAFMSAFLSNTTVTLMLAPVVMFITDDIKLKTRCLLAVAYGSSIGGILTPIGTPPNLIFLGFIDQFEHISISFISWILLTAPFVILMLVVMPYILSIGLENIQLEKNREVIAFDFEKKKISYILLLLAILLIVNSPIKPYYDGLGLNEYMILTVFGFLLFMPKIEILTWDDVRSFPLEILFLFGAGFTIAMAFSETKLATEITNYLTHFGGVGVFVILIIVVFAVSFLTEITSNTALTSIALPIFYEFAKVLQYNETLIMLAVTISASCAFMLPIGTPPNAIIMSSRIVKVKDMVSFGFMIHMLAVLTLILIGYFYWNNVL